MLLSFICKYVSIFNVTATSKLELSMIWHVNTVSWHLLHMKMRNWHR